MKSKAECGAVADSEYWRQFWAVRNDPIIKRFYQKMASSLIGGEKLNYLKLKWKVNQRIKMRYGKLLESGVQDHRGRTAIKINGDAQRSKDSILAGISIGNYILRNADRIIKRRRKFNGDLLARSSKQNRPHSGGNKKTNRKILSRTNKK